MPQPEHRASGRRELFQQRDAPPRHEQPCAAAAHGEDEAFREQLSGETRTTRADRRPHRHLAPPSGRPREQNVGHVHARDEQHEADGAEQEQQRAADRRLHALLASREQRRVEHDLVQATAALSRMVLPPLSLPPRIKRIVVVADGALQFIPFAMLSPRRGRPLLADYEVTAAPSASVVALMRKLNGARGGGAGIAVVADPVFRADDPRVGGKATPNNAAFRSANDIGLKNLERLPYTRSEADAIVRLARGATLRAVDFDASRGTVTSAAFGQYAVIHFATHALLNTKHPELSGIVLSLVDRRGRPLDGFLSAADIYALHLRGSLVVLSACRTALGKDVRGEGLVGLVRAFMYAGAPSVVASYWDVGDADTAEVMKRFYRRLLSGHEKPSAALRDAQLSIAKERGWRSPRSWAAFTLQGDWERRRPAGRPGGVPPPPP